MTLPQITFYGGVSEIGGNKVLLEDKDTRIFLDFGMSFSEGLKYYSPDIRPRAVNGLGDYFEFDLMPKIEGVYSQEMLQGTELKYKKPELDAILLSHYHVDHFGRIGFTDPDIPVYCGETTQLFHSAYTTFRSGSSLEGHQISTFRTGDRIKIGSLEVRPIHVDHSIPGAYGFIIHYSNGTLVYSGDFRFHGTKGDMTKEFVEAASKERPDYLVTEGTRVALENRKEDLSEPEVVIKTVEVLKKIEGKKKLAFSSFRGNDIDRINSFYSACKETGRQFVVSMKSAAILQALEMDKNIAVPRVGRDILVYLRRKKSGGYDDKDYDKWERPFLNSGVTCDDIKRAQGEMFLHLDVFTLPEMIDIKPDSGGVYIHSSSEAFNEEGEEEEELIKNWVDHFGFSYHHIHASGHAPASAVKKFVSEVDASTTIPIHTEHPELFSEMIKKEGIKFAAKAASISI